MEPDPVRAPSRPPLRSVSQSSHSIGDTVMYKDRSGALLRVSIMQIEAPMPGEEAAFVIKMDDGSERGTVASKLGALPKSAAAAALESSGLQRAGADREALARADRARWREDPAVRYGALPLPVLVLVMRRLNSALLLHRARRGGRDHTAARRVLRAGLVCRSWRKASASPGLWKLLYKARFGPCPGAKAELYQQLYGHRVSAPRTLSDGAHLAAPLPPHLRDPVYQKQQAAEWEAAELKAVAEGAERERRAAELAQMDAQARAMAADAREAMYSES